jgi:hypothetical protein
VRQGGELADDRLPGEKKPAIRHVIMLESKAEEYNQFAANGKCVFSVVSHPRGSAQGYEVS